MRELMLMNGDIITVTNEVTFKHYRYCFNGYNTFQALALPGMHYSAER
jgi:hypothetical protein